MVFSNLCGLRIKQTIDPELQPKKIRGRGRPPVDNVKRKALPEGATTSCAHYPFSSTFDYIACATYQEIFETKGLRNGAVPTKDFQYSESLSGISVTEMELL
jgi:hypothetical protein